MAQRSARMLSYQYRHESDMLSSARTAQTCKRVFTAPHAQTRSRARMRVRHVRENSVEMCTILARISRIDREKSRRQTVSYEGLRTRLPIPVHVLISISEFGKLLRDDMKTCSP